MKKKNAVKKSLRTEVSPEEAVRFIEDLRLMSSQIDEPTVAISLRVPENILRSLKIKARAEGKKYQSLMIEYLRSGLQRR